MNDDAALLERESLARLSRVHGPAELRAVILALIVPADSPASVLAWSAETSACAHAPSLRDDVMRLGEGTRVPCLETTLDRLRSCSKEDRRLLLESARRVMAALRPLRPIDRLHWLLMRRRLGEKPPVAAWHESHDSLAGLPALTIVRIASVAAYLARMVPSPDRSAGQLWYEHAMAPLVSPESMPPCLAPDGDGLARALLDVEALPWMLRPVLMRAWVDAALATSERARLWPMAADALRIVARLLDCPLPPKLARHFNELAWELGF